MTFFNGIISARTQGRTGHMIIDDIDELRHFLGTWGGRRKKPIVLTRRKKALPDADRQVSSQPLLFAKDVYNIRKLSELPYHLIRAEKFEDLDDEILFNFEWINAKIKGQSLSDVLLDYENAICVSEDMDMR